MTIARTFPLMFLCIGMSSFGESTAPSEGRPDWWGDIPGFLNEQHSHSLSVVESLLRQYPPTLEPSAERRAAFLLLDNVLHDPEAGNRKAVQAFLAERTKVVCTALKETQVTNGARIWKLYNDGFVVRTPSATIAFDIITGKHVGNGSFILPEALVEDFARQCDALFISHLHEDHADLQVVQAFLRNNKPVSVPEGLWKDQPFGDRLVRLKREAETEQAIPIRDGDDRLSVINYPGHQGEMVLNNVVLVTTPDGLTFAQTGDQSNNDDFAWIDGVGEKHRVDVLMPNCWAPELPRMIAGFRPSLVIPGHQNELDHTIDHREPYWLDPVRLGKEVSRTVILAWGESYEYIPQKER